MISIMSPVQNSQMLSIIPFTSLSLCQVVYTCDINNIYDEEIQSLRKKE